jgi:hypothetical protein
VPGRSELLLLEPHPYTTRSCYLIRVDDRVCVSDLMPGKERRERCSTGRQI